MPTLDILWYESLTGEPREVPPRVPPEGEPDAAEPQGLPASAEAGAAKPVPRRWLGRRVWRSPRAM